MTSTDKPPTSRLGRELRQVRQGTLATAAEVKEFMHSLRGRPPQEVLGAVAQSGLVQAVIVASVGTIVLMGVFTVLPYMLWGPIDVIHKKATPAATAEATPATNPPATATSTDPQTAPAAATEQDRAQQVLEKLDESETKMADPDVNPLDNLDNLLESDSTNPGGDGPARKSK